ncbi:MAG: radical SAM protein [Spirochaetes bacterium]|nr:radical SAM protein [Spirochaetota bacterium]
MKILLIVPCFNSTDKVNYEYIFPIGLGYISSTLKKAKYDVTCLNLNHKTGKLSDLVNSALDEQDYDVLSMGHIGTGYLTIKELINTAHNHKSKPITIIGGSIISSEPEFMANNLNFDYGIIGEGERTMLGLLECIKNNSNPYDVAGIVYKDANKVIITEPRPVIEDLDTIPIPDFDGFDFRELLDNTCSNDNLGSIVSDYPRVYPIICSRGCPFNCTFCYHSLGIKYRIRSIDNVIDELRESINRYRINSIFIYDDLFSVDKVRLTEFCKKIKKLFTQISWDCNWLCQLSVNTVDKTMLKMLKDSGCNFVSYGFESMSPIVLKSMKKPITPEKIDEAFRETIDIGIAIQANFIFGDSAETIETAKETLDYWRKTKGQIRLGFIQPYPGSEIYNRCIERGIIKNKLDFMNTLSHGEILHYNMTEKLNDVQFNQLIEDIDSIQIKYGYFVSPSAMTKHKKNIYDIKVICPFCKKKIIYKNFRITNKITFSHFTICKKCMMRFFIVSNYTYFTNKYYFWLKPLRKLYTKLKNYKRWSITTV